MATWSSSKMVIFILQLMSIYIFVEAVAWTGNDAEQFTYYFSGDVLSHLTCAIPAWGSFLIVALSRRIRRFLKKSFLLCIHKQEAQLSPRDRAMRCVNWNLANCHATVQKLLLWQVLAKLMVWSWGFSRRQCVIDNVHSTMTRPSRFHLSQMCHKQTDDGRLVDITCIPTTCCGEIF